MKKISVIFLAAFIFLPGALCRGTEINIQTETFEIVPKLRVTLPGGIVDIFLNQRISRTLIDFGFRYDFFNNYISCNLDARYYLPKYFLGTNFNDSMGFEVFFDNIGHIQRTRYIKLYSGANLAQNLEFNVSVRSENTFTIASNYSTPPDTGRNIPAGIGIQYNTLKETEIFPSGTRVWMDLTSNLGILGGDYNYSQADLYFIQYAYPFGSNYIKIFSRVGYPVSTVRRPLGSYYYIGGYDILRGYGNGQFYGNSLMYTQLSYHVPLVKTFGQGNRSLEVITGDLQFEFAKVGEVDIFRNLENMKASVGIGFGCTMTFLKNVNTKFDLFFGKAFDNRDMVIYFSLRAFNYVRER